MEYSQPLILQKRDGQPLFRICVVKNQHHIDVKYNPEYYRLYDQNGNQFIQDARTSQSETRWRIKIKKSVPAVYNHYLILHQTRNKTLAKNFLKKNLKYDANIFVKKVGSEILLDGKFISNTQSFLVISGPFTSGREAKHHSKCFGELNHCRVFSELVKPGEGVLEIFNSDFENLTEIDNGLSFESVLPNAWFCIQRQKIQQGTIRKSHIQDLCFKGDLQLMIDENGQLMAVNQVDLDNYLRAVLQSELGDTDLPEFTGAMAILTRSQIFARMKQKHFGEPFDFCSDSHCLRYYGKKRINPVIEQAVRRTDGLVLTCQNSVCDGYFHYSCGGHTENTGEVWQDGHCEYVSAKFDTALKTNDFDLHNEDDVRKWILNRPNVYCKINTDEAPGSKELQADSFRWEVFYTRPELEQILIDKTGEDVGMICEIIPLKRGSSGRINEIQILGSLKNVKIIGELNIRSAFSETFLNSSCFIVNSQLDEDGVPINFVFIGAGKGHGVGLCKVGASKMALEGFGYQEILNHYFENCQIRKII